MNIVARSIFIFSLLIPAWSSGQNVPLTLQEALHSAQQNNQSIHISQLDVSVSHANYKQTQAVFLPQVNLGYSAMRTNNPLNAFGFKLQQQAITASDFDPNVLNDPAATQNFMVKAEVLQPIFNLDGLYQRQAAGNQAEAYQWKHIRTKQYVLFDVEKAYAQLQLAHRAVAVLEEAVSTAQSVYTVTNNRFEKGYLQKSDVLHVQVHATNSESRLAEARSNVQNASDYLSLLMGTPTGVVYAVDTTTQVNEVQSIDTTLPENRADFMAMQKAVQARDNLVKSGTMAYVPTLNAFGEYLFNDAEAFGFGSDSYLIGAQLSWKIFNGTATKNKVDAQRSERDKAVRELQYQKEQAQLELSKTQRQQQDARLTVNQQALAVQQAEEALRLIQNRYEQGLVTTTDLLQAQTMVSQQKLIWAQAVFQLNTTQAYLRFLTTTSNE
jgi:outer membrane protein TolC